MQISQEIINLYRGYYFFISFLYKDHSTYMYVRVTGVIRMEVLFEGRLDMRIYGKYLKIQLLIADESETIFMQITLRNLTKTMKWLVLINLK